jgi:valyl-tRNA synthetase
MITMELPKNYNPHESEKKWQEFWEQDKVFMFDPESKQPIYSIDTPPPTVSGKMHMGHAFSYSQTDFIARYKRMNGFNIFYPFGTDDNGLPTQTLVEKTKKVKASHIGREAFRKLCQETLDNELRPKYIADFKRIGLSCDFRMSYTTINDHCRKISQKSFMDLYKAGREYRKEAPAMWCPHCQTAISQVECQDEEISSSFNDLVFKADGKDIIISTTRPELLPACVAVFYNPCDMRYKSLKGKKAVVPLFNFEVPILEDDKADPNKGTGLVMCCTFGDSTDAEWQKIHSLPIKEAITKDGKMTELSGKYCGQQIKAARKMIIEDLKQDSLLISQKPIVHSVNVHERCGTEIEFIHSKQWFIKYLDLKEKMLAWGDQLSWYPQYMKNRYDNWVKGLQWDWCISRQIYFGVPFPVWYCVGCDEVILADEKDLPVDPISNAPPVSRCPKCDSSNLMPETDVINTWATSSLTPQITASLVPDLYDQIYPMTIRPQGHDIITFWLFNTVVKSQLHNDVNPWKECMISGWALDSKGKKMSKSKGNVVEPQQMIEKYSADAVRFWAASSTLGEDLPFQEKDLLTGQKTITKLWNAFKFSLVHLEAYMPKEILPPENLEMMDKWLLTKLHKMIQGVTDAFERYDYSRTKLDVEKFFWITFCDNYLEISKDRLYNPDTRGNSQQLSAQFTLYNAFLSILKLFAPIMPFITEEIYSLYFSQREKNPADNISQSPIQNPPTDSISNNSTTDSSSKRSIHKTEWPKYDVSLVDEKAEQAGDLFIAVLQEVRKAKSEAKKSLKEPVSEIIIEGKIPLDLFEKLEDDLKATTKAEKVLYKILPKDSQKDYVCDIIF